MFFVDDKKNEEEKYFLSSSVDADKLKKVKTYEKPIRKKSDVSLNDVIDKKSIEKVSSAKNKIASEFHDFSNIIFKDMPRSVASLFVKTFNFIFKTNVKWVALSIAIAGALAGTIAPLVILKPWETKIFYSDSEILNYLKPSDFTYNPCVKLTNDTCNHLSYGPNETQPQSISYFDFIPKKGSTAEFYGVKPQKVIAIEKLREAHYNFYVIFQKNGFQSAPIPIYVRYLYQGLSDYTVANNMKNSDFVLNDNLRKDFPVIPSDSDLKKAFFKTYTDKISLSNDVPEDYRRKYDTKNKLVYVNGQTVDMKYFVDDISITTRHWSQQECRKEVTFRIIISRGEGTSTTREPKYTYIYSPTGGIC